MEWHEHSDDSLIAYGASHGARDQAGAAMEMQRRLLVAIRAFNTASGQQATTMIRLTIAIAALTVALLLIAGVQTRALLRPTAASPEQLYQRAVRCAEDGRTFAAAYLAKQRAEQFMADAITQWDDPEFHYNTARGTCLVRTRWVEMGTDLHSVMYDHARVTDLSSNQAVAESYLRVTPYSGTQADTMIDGRPNLPRAAYQARADDLMKQ